ARYIYTGDEADYRAATFFWDQVALHHSFATGGHGKNEYFGLPDKLNDMIDGRTAETCDVYNMIKMARDLFSVEPDIRYADFLAGQSASLQITSDTPRKFTLALRRPYWAGTGFSVKVNGELLTNLPKADSYVEINRTWKKEDKVELVLPKTLRTEPLPDNPNRLALMWGPLVLAGDLGQERKRGPDRNAEPQAPVLVAAAQPVENWLKPVTGKPG